MQIDHKLNSEAIRVRLRTLQGQFLQVGKFVYGRQGKPLTPRTAVPAFCILKDTEAYGNLVTLLPANLMSEVAF